MDTGVTRVWNIRPYRQGDERALGILYERIFARPFDESIWRWQFERAIENRGYIVFAEHGSTLVGQYATIPVRMHIRGKKTLGALSLDTMTHPEYRKQGIFVALAKEVYGRTQSFGVALVFGFPNDNSFHGFVTDLDFAVLENLVAMARPVCIARAVREKMKYPFLAAVIGRPLQSICNAFCSKKTTDAAITVESASRFPESVTTLFDGCPLKSGSLVVRDYEYLSWRYDRNPRHSYDIFLGYRNGTLAGYCVSGTTERKGLTIGLIVDLFADPHDRALTTSLVTAALEVMERKEMHLASCLLPSKSPFRATLRRLGFVFPMRRFPFIIRANSDAITSEALMKGAGWHITFGDGDFV